ncbi:DUF2130 domain-containing protein [Mycoplasma mycoides]|uniref:DUF2130 domain-containing protein n=1 Tax=Mycoplasma mycoides TaxID=2102 RepID=UPI002E765272|nr:DUF2130 domain-containing protein [Mycoplasma mycoides]
MEKDLINEYNKKFESTTIEISDLKATNKTLIEKLENNKKEFEQLISQKLELESNIKLLNEKLNQQEKLIKLQLENQYNILLNKQKEQFEQQINQLKKWFNKNTYELENKDWKHKSELTELITTKNNKNNKNNRINKLEQDLEFIKREKLTKNIKLVGEELENYCLNQFNEASMFAFKTSTLIKDNIVIKNEDDLKGTKGDFIFKVYAEKEKQNLLLSVMCEMKSEQLNSHNKKKSIFITVYLLFFFFFL